MVKNYFCQTFLMSENFYICVHITQICLVNTRKLYIHFHKKKHVESVMLPSNIMGQTYDSCFVPMLRLCGSGNEKSDMTSFLLESIFNKVLFVGLSVCSESFELGEGDH
jgi:hypothetical protein